MLEFSSDEAMKYSEKPYLGSVQKVDFYVVASITLYGHRFAYSISLPAAHVS
jgi:hypothetical protein